MELVDQGDCKYDSEICFKVTIGFDAYISSPKNTVSLWTSHSGCHIGCHAKYRARCCDVGHDVVLPVILAVVADSYAKVVVVSCKY